MALTSVDLAGLALDVVSIGGLATAVDVPSFKAAVDLGDGDERLSRRRDVFLTHAHVDHAGSLTHHVGLRALRRLPPPRYHVPRAIVARVEAFLEALRALQEDALPAEVVGLAPGDEVRLGRELVVRPFAMEHRVPAQGYTFLRRTMRLRPELVGQSGEMLAARRRAGESVDRPVDALELAVAGDGTIDGILASADALAARRLVLEVTFLDERVSPAAAHSKGHTHLADLVRHADAFRHAALLITHLSSRYTANEARALLRAGLPADLAERCQVLHADGVFPVLSAP